jgi:hypothetical protein
VRPRRRLTRSHPSRGRGPELLTLDRLDLKDLGIASPGTSPPPAANPFHLDAPPLPARALSQPATRLYCGTRTAPLPAASAARTPVPAAPSATRMPPDAAHVRGSGPAGHPGRRPRPRRPVPPPSTHTRPCACLITTPVPAPPPPLSCPLRGRRASESSFTARYAAQRSGSPARRRRAVSRMLSRTRYRPPPRYGTVSYAPPVHSAGSAARCVAEMRRAAGSAEEEARAVCLQQLQLSAGPPGGPGPPGSRAVLPAAAATRALARAAAPGAVTAGGGRRSGALGLPGGGGAAAAAMVNWAVRCCREHARRGPGRVLVGCAAVAAGEARADGWYPCRGGGGRAVQALQRHQGFSRAGPGPSFIPADSMGRAGPGRRRSCRTSR